MWQILKSELKYHKNLILFSSLIVLTAFIGNLVYSWRNTDTYLNGVIELMIYIFLIFVAIKLNLDNKAKRLRVYSALPLKLWQIGLSRLLIFIFVWSTYLGLFWLTSAFIRPYPVSKMIWQMLSINGYMLALMAVFAIMNDLYHTFHTVQGGLLIGVIGLVYLGAQLFLLDIPGFDTIRNQWIKSVVSEFIFLISNMQGAIILNLIGFLFIVLNIFTFIKRKYYL